MHKAYKNLKDCIKNNPLGLLAIKDKKLLKVVESYLPVDTGIEIECSPINSNLRINEISRLFEWIPNLYEAKCSGNEQRFRLPSGVNGFVCLYQICEQLKKSHALNYGSGIHYHVDCTDFIAFDGWSQKTKEVIKKQQWILDALKSWNYTGQYNKWEITDYKTAVKIHELGTIEYRIGEMTFDYELMVKRILHCHEITKKQWFKWVYRSSKKILFVLLYGIFMGVAICGIITLLVIPYIKFNLITALITSGIFLFCLISFIVHLVAKELDKYHVDHYVNFVSGLMGVIEIPFIVTYHGFKWLFYKVFSTISDNCPPINWK